MKRRSKRRKLCPQGVARDCLYCIELWGKVWRVLDPKGETIDESSDRDDATSIADGYISQCMASKSGYGVKTKKVEFRTDGEFKWKRVGKA